MYNTKTGKSGGIILAQKISQKYIEDTVREKYKGDILLPEDFQYDYIRAKFKCICRIHGEIETTVDSLLKTSKGCKECNLEYRGERVANAVSVSEQEMVERIEGTFSHVRYVRGFVNMGTACVFACDVHGEFTRIPHNMDASPFGCQKCAREDSKKKRSMTPEEFLHRAQSMHPTLDFSKFIYKGFRDSSVVICATHGSFNKTPLDLLVAKRGCKICSGYTHTSESIVPKLRKALVERYGEELGSKFGLEQVVYTGTCEHVDIVCPKHGVFKVTPANLIRLHRGCPTCGRGGQHKSKAECWLLEMLKDEHVVKHNDRTVLGGMEIDIYLPEHKVGIEYHGITYHSTEFKRDSYHREKYERAEKKGVHLLQIYSDEFEKDKYLILSMILSAVRSYGQKIYARKTEVVVLDQSEYREFCEKNHVQGYRSAKVCLGLRHQGELVSCMSFVGNELARFCNLAFTNVVGGFSKLFKSYLRDHCLHSEIVSYCDLRYFRGEVYLANGFELSHTTKPGYSYVINRHTRESRQKYQKRKLAGKLEVFDPDATERDNMIANGYHRIYDCGHKLFVFKVGSGGS